jgi:hypothetical protein
MAAVYGHKTPKGEWLGIKVEFEMYDKNGVRYVLSTLLCYDMVELAQLARHALQSEAKMKDGTKFRVRVIANVKRSTLPIPRNSLQEMCESANKSYTEETNLFMPAPDPSLPKNDVIASIIVFEGEEDEECIYSSVCWNMYELTVVSQIIEDMVLDDQGEVYVVLSLSDNKEEPL